MSSNAPGWRDLASACLVASLVIACGAEEIDAPAELALASEPADADEGQIGRIHLVLEPSQPSLQVTARFLQFRGLDPSYVRARFDVAALPQQLPLGCHPGDEVEDEALAELEPDPDGRDLLLLDAGNIRVEFGEHRFDLPLSLVPDLVPYVAGVEYMLTVEELDGLLPGDEPGAITIDVEGAGDDDLPGFTHQADMPVPLDLRVDVQGFDRDAVMIRWRPDPGGDSRVRALSLRLVSKSGGEPTGSEILCVVPDTGEFQLDLPHLRALGLGGSGDLLEVAASRSDLGRFETGAFTRGEVLIEIRDHTSLRLP